MPSQWQRACLLFLAVITALLGMGCRSSPKAAIVTQVIDGDTIVIQGGAKVRYIGIDAPEKEEPYYAEAKQANETLVIGRKVRLEKDVSDRDKYGRLLRYVYVEGLFVNAELVRLGYARAKAYPPDTRYQDLLEEKKQEAKRAERGMWGPMSHSAFSREWLRAMRVFEDGEEILSYDLAA